MKRRAVLYLAAMIATVSLALAMHTPEGSHTQSFSVGKGGTLEVFVGSADITIATWNKDEVSVTVTQSDDEESEGVTMRQTGKTVRIESSPGSSADYRLAVTIPAQFDLDLHSGSGDIGITGPLTGSVKGKTGAGNVRLEGLGGKIEFSTAGGDVTSGDVQGDLIVETSGGDIHLGKVSGNADALTSGGEVSVQNVGKQLRVRTSGGNVSIGDVGGEANVSTAGGDIIAGVVSGSAVLATAGGNVVLHGASGNVRAKTAGGDLQLEGIGGSLEAATAGGNISATLKGGKIGKSKLSTSAGEILLTVPETVKATIHARIKVRGWWRNMSDAFEIRSDFKTETYEKDEHSHEIRASIPINGGGETITLETNMGNIAIRKAKP